MLLFSVFVLYPIVQSVRYSLYDWNGLEPLDHFVGLDNFRRAFHDPVFRGAMRHNMIIIVLSVDAPDPGRARAGGPAEPEAGRARRCCARCSSRRTCCPRSSTGVVWRQILRPDGLLDQSLRAVGAGGLVHEWLADPQIVLYSLFFVISWKYFGFHMVIMLAGLQQIPKELAEAAAIDGATGWQTLPLRHPAACSARRSGCRCSCRSSARSSCSTSSGSPRRGGPINASSTMATYLYDQFRKGLFGYASAVSVVIFTLSLIVALLYQRLVLRRDLRGTGLVG